MRAGHQVFAIMQAAVPLSLCSHITMAWGMEKEHIHGGEPFALVCIPVGMKSLRVTHKNVLDRAHVHSHLHTKSSLSE